MIAELFMLFQAATLAQPPDAPSAIGEAPPERDASQPLLSGALIILDTDEEEAGDAGSASGREYYRRAELPPEFPFSSAVVVGDMIHLSGEIGIKYDTFTLVEGGVGPETRQIFKNYEATLAELNADLSNIVKCTVFLDDMDDYAEMNAAYAEALPDPKPARSTFGVDGLALGAALEIECMAVRSGDARQ